MRRLSVPVLAGLGFLLSCASPATDSPADFTAPPANAVANACATVDQLRLQINALFPVGGTRTEANNRLSAIAKLVKKPDAANAQVQMFRLVEYMLARYYAHGLIGDQAPATQTGVLTLMNGLYCLVGLPEPNLPGSSLGEDGVVAVVGPTTPATTVVTPSAQAGVDLPGASVPTTTVIAVFRLPDSPGPLNTPLDQYPAYYEFQVSPAVTFTSDVLVGACQVDNFTPPDYTRLKLGHNLGTTGFELLPRVTPAFLDCTSIASQSGPTIDGTCCLGGSTRTFSPFGAVDTLTIMDANSQREVRGAPNAPVGPSDLPSVQIKTPTGRPVPGITVTFSIPAGNEGSLTGAVQVTDANGIAKLGGWTLGAGVLPNNVIATGTPLLGSGIDGNGQGFNATFR